MNYCFQKRKTNSFEKAMLVTVTVFKPFYKNILLFIVLGALDAACEGESYDNDLLVGVKWKVLVWSVYVLSSTQG